MIVMDKKYISFAYLIMTLKLVANLKYTQEAIYQKQGVKTV